MTATEQIKQIINDECIRRGQTLAQINQDIDQAIIFWSQCADQYIAVFDTEDVDARYRFDQEWTVYWDTVEKLYPKYILRPLA